MVNVKILSENKKILLRLSDSVQGRRVLNFRYISAFEHGRVLIVLTYRLRVHI